MQRWRRLRRGWLRGWTIGLAALAIAELLLAAVVLVGKRFLPELVATRISGDPFDGWMSAIADHVSSEKRSAIILAKELLQW